MRNKFDEQLHSLDEQLTHMGELCETAIAKATQALKDGSIEQASVSEIMRQISLSGWNSLSQAYTKTARSYTRVSLRRPAAEQQTR